MCIHTTERVFRITVRGLQVIKIQLGIPKAYLQLQLNKRKVSEKNCQDRGLNTGPPEDPELRLQSVALPAELSRRWEVSIL